MLIFSCILGHWDKWAFALALRAIIRSRCESYFFDSFELSWVLTNKWGKLFWSEEKIQPNLELSWVLNNKWGKLFGSEEKNKNSKNIQPNLEYFSFAIWWNFWWEKNGRLCNKKPRSFRWATNSLTLTYLVMFLCRQLLCK